LTFNPAEAMIMTHTHAKGQGQRSLGIKVRLEADGWTDMLAETAIYFAVKYYVDFELLVRLSPSFVNVYRLVAQCLSLLFSFFDVGCMLVNCGRC